MNNAHNHTTRYTYIYNKQKRQSNKQQTNTMQNTTHTIQYNIRILVIGLFIHQQYKYNQHNTYQKNIVTHNKQYIYIYS